MFCFPESIILMHRNHIQSVTNTIPNIKMYINTGIMLQIIIRGLKCSDDTETQFEERLIGEFPVLCREDHTACARQYLHFLDVVPEQNTMRPQAIAKEVLPLC